VAKLIYLSIASLDGYVADEHGNFDWGEPSEQDAREGLQRQNADRTGIRP
jgi:hypothetical protein